MRALKITIGHVIYNPTYLQIPTENHLCNVTKRCLLTSNSIIHLEKIFCSDLSMAAIKSIILLFHTSKNC